MKIIQDPEELRGLVRELKRRRKSIGFVPTMGYLHEGHLSLVRRAAKENKRVIASIFVNPLQFGPKEDFWRYPRNLGRDTALLKKEKTDILFLPPVKEFYKEDFQTSVSLNELSRPLCGVSRPTHFTGVATVVLKLLNIVSPNTLYLGQKDYQQFRVVEQMVKDLSVDTKVRLMGIVREEDGLAMSSRNSLLTSIERKEAVFLYRSLERAKQLIESGQRDTIRIKKACREVLKHALRAKTDYFEIVDAQTLKPVVKLNKSTRILVAGAIFFSKTRLIDNTLLTV